MIVELKAFCWYTTDWDRVYCVPPDWNQHVDIRKLGGKKARIEGELFDVIRVEGPDHNITIGFDGGDAVPMFVPETFKVYVKRS